MSKHEEENRRRLIGMLDRVQRAKTPQGWEHAGSFAVGGLLSVGFSRKLPCKLLVVSSSGRGLFLCEAGEKIERDYEEFVGLDDTETSCLGIGELADENIPVMGIAGGGLPCGNSVGETLELVSPRWPMQDLIFGPLGKNALIPGDQAHCKIIYSEHVRAFGFSWCGNYIVAACGSDFDLWRKL